MTEGQSWLPDTVKNLLKNSEAHYRSIGFRRVASLMSSTLNSASDIGPITPEFYTKYVRCLTDDSAQLVRSFGFPKNVTEYFVNSMARSIDLVQQVLTELDSLGKTPTFNGTTGKKEDAEAIQRFFSENELSDPVQKGSDPADILAAAEPFFDMVYEHVFRPGRDYLISQLDLAAGHDRMLVVSEEILSIEKAVRQHGEVFSDFRYVQTHPGDLSDDGSAWKVLDDFDVPVDRFSRWAYFIYYKVPILTAMLPVHNIIFFALVQDTIEKRRSEGLGHSV